MKTIETTSAPACCAPLSAAALSNDDADRAAGLFKSLGDSARVRIVNILARTDEAACVCDLLPEVGLSQPTVSFHLKKLLEAGLVQREQRGKWAYYSLRPGALAELAAVLDPREARSG